MGGGAVIRMPPGDVHVPISPGHHAALFMLGSELTHPHSRGAESMLTPRVPYH
jgi:hypothetical protein